MAEHPAACAADIARGYRTHIITPRWVACLIDYGVLFVLLFVIYGSLHTFDPAVPWTVWAIVAVCYFVVPEAYWGVTLGKRYTKVIVVTNHGEAPGLARALVRCAFRLLEINPLLCGGLPAGLVACASKTKRRLGDMAAGTYVLYRSDVLDLRQERRQAAVEQRDAADEAHGGW